MPLLMVAACGDSDSDEAEFATSTPVDSPSGVPASIGGIIDGEVGGDINVLGYVVIDQSGTRFCSVLLESFPPQCGAPSVDLVDLDTTVVDLRTEQGVRWTDDVVILFGRYSDGTFTVLDLGEAQSPPPVETSESTTTTTRPTTTTSEPTTTASDTCPAGPDMSPDATNPNAITADLDLDGVDEVAMTYFTPDQGRWRIRVEWGEGGATDQIIDDSGATLARPIGLYDVDGDATPELFTIVGSGAATVLVGLYDVAGCELARVTLGGEEVSFPVGATVQHVSGLSCGPVGDLDRLFADLVADDTFEGGVEPFTLSGSRLTAEFGDGATFTPEEAAALAVFDCGDLQL